MRVRAHPRVPADHQKEATMADAKITITYCNA